MTDKNKMPYSRAYGVRHLKRVDSTMRQLITLVGPCRLEYEFELTPYQSLLRAIVFQQLATPAATAIYQRLQALFPAPCEITPEQLLSVPRDQLRAVGLSQGKILSVYELSTMQLAGDLPNAQAMQSMDDEEIIASFSMVRGIGRWTVEMMLLHKLGRPNILPVTDLGIRKGYQLSHRLEELPNTRILKDKSLLWSPYCSVASWYLWRATDSVDWSKIS